ncbi:hypothetical protein [Gemmatimonas groenlandica]|uniref:Uncharacterized protein n=1 Tax=Gemmatimonas groenlandica TaxID=2732249 RepID=A0A6M4ITS3_9BACT|nr:hypothetical protein [Gemmatimonas groenlandica]QJR37528.1 hypothetical protein HKW67_19420 [Gemmatimonas groenlandica]
MTDTSLNHIDVAFRLAVASLPAALRSLLDVELAAGNRIIDVGHTHPAPPVGAFVMLEQPVSTQPRHSTADIRFYDRNNSSYRGEFADPSRFFFVLEAPGPRPEPPDMDAIREAANPSSPPERERSSGGSDAWQRFARSRQLDYERWREGIGYDLEALAQMSAAEQATTIESLIPPSDWRDVEALVAVGSARAIDALQRAAEHGAIAVRLAIADRAPELVDDALHTEMLRDALTSAEIMSGLSEALDQIEEFHPPVVVDALFAGLIERDGAVAYHCAATLAVIYGKIDSRFDWSMRPLFLRFNTERQTERLEARRELRRQLGVSPDERET